MLLWWLLACTPEPLEACEDACPGGTRRVQIDQVSVERSDVFSWSVGQSCEVWCEPELPCLPPNLPVVDAETYACRPQEGFSDIPLPSEVDTSFGLLWTGGGTTSPPVEGTIESSGLLAVSFATLTALDADGNGNPELYGANPTGTVGHRLEAVGMDLQLVSSVVVSIDPVSGAAPAKLNSDAYADWVIWSELAQSVDVIFSQDASLTTPGGVLASGTGVEEVVSVDVDGDGWRDVMIDGELVLFNEAAAASFTAVEVDGVSGGWGGPSAWGDVDGDGRLDLARGHGLGAVYVQGEGRTFTATQGFLGSGPVGGVSLADLDGDGLDDWVALQTGNDCVDVPCLEVHYSLGDGRFEVGEPEVWPTELPLALRGGCDLDGDGLDDVAALVDDQVVMWAGGEMVQTPLGGSYTRLDLVDLDQDGRCEAVALATTDIQTSYVVVTP